VYHLHFKPSLVPDNELYPSDGLYPLAAEGVRLVEEGLIVMDFKRGNKFSYNLYSHKATTSVGEYKGKAHAISAELDKVFLECEKPLDCNSPIECTQYSFNVLGAYENTRLTKLSYISPRFIDGSLSTLKQYEKVRLNIWGSFNVRVIFSDGSVAVEEYINNTSKSAINDTLQVGDVEFSDDDMVIIGIPNNNNLSYSIGFIIEGEGVIKSIQYSWKGRELQ